MVTLMKRLIPVVVLVALLAACQFPGVHRIPQGPPTTPEQAIQRHVAANIRSTEQLNHVTIHQIRPFLGKSVIGLFTYETASSQQPSTALHINYAVVEPQGHAWNVTRAKGFGRSPLPTVVGYQTDTLNGARIVFGQIFDRRITSVEIDFESGHTEQTTLEEGSFFILDPTGSNPQAVRLMNEQGHIMEQFTESELIR